LDTPSVRDAVNISISILKNASNAEQPTILAAARRRCGSGGAFRDLMVAFKF